VFRKIFVRGVLILGVNVSAPWAGANGFAMAMRATPNVRGKQDLLRFLSPGSTISKLLNKHLLEFRARQGLKIRHHIIRACIK
jgi:hypothetical protein